MTAPVPGVCLYCRATDEQVDGNKLSWHDATRTCCSRYACVKAHHLATRGKQARPRSRFQELIAMGYGYGAAQQQIQREERRRRRTRRKKAA